MNLIAANVFLLTPFLAFVPDHEAGEHRQEPNSFELLYRLS